jgi:hypothetical protein
MSGQLQIRRNTSTGMAAFTGAVSELVHDTTNDRVRLHNGSTVGGIPLARLDETVAPPYSGSSANNVAYPIGAMLTATLGSSTPLNTTVTLYVLTSGSPTQATDSATSATALTGTWKTRGLITGSTYLVQRTG